jgi:hypothetical protein
VVSGGWITPADRERRQRAAVRELAAILGGSDGLPLIAWTVGAAGGGLTGQVAGAGGRAAFTAWQRALAMDDVAETAVSGGIWLRARAWRGGVRVTVTATVGADGDAAVTW